MIALIAALILSGCGAGAGNTDTSAQQDAAASQTAGAQADNADSGLLRGALNADITTMDVHKTSNDYMVPMNIYDTLFTIRKKDDGSTEIVNSLADSYDLSDDALT